MNTCGVRQRCTQGVQSRCAIEVWLSGVSKEDKAQRERVHAFASQDAICVAFAPSPTLSPTDPVPRGLLTLCPGAY